MYEQLLIQFLTHRCSAEERKLIDQWISESKTNADWLFEMERIWSLKAELHFSEKQEIEAAYSRFVNGINKEEFPQSTKRFTLTSLAKYAAAILIVGLLSINLYYMQQEEDVTLNTVEVPDGQRASLTLSDGTKVWLNSQSKLTYPTRFSENDRNVELEGEAFFDVTHNGRVPFIVHSSFMDIKVLGTRFNVKVYTNEVAFVTLAEGKVEIATTDNENRLTLKPHEQASYSKEGGLNLVKQVDAEVYTSWTSGEMCFVNRRLDEIAKDLERHFEVKITIRDRRLAAELFSCRFKESTSINQVLNLLKETRNLDYSIDGNKILFYYPK